MFRSVPGVFRGVPWCSVVFRGVPECSGVFRGVPVFRCSGVPVFLVLVHATVCGLITSKIGRNVAIGIKQAAKRDENKEWVVSILYTTVFIVVQIRVSQQV